MWLIETDVFQMPQLHKHFNVVSGKAETLNSKAYNVCNTGGMEWKCDGSYFTDIFSAVDLSFLIYKMVIATKSFCKATYADK